MKRYLFIIGLFIFSFVVLYGHPGRLDRNGGHNGPGGYHYHVGSGTPSSSSSNSTVNNQDGNESSKDFLQGTVLARQEGETSDKFPKFEIGFVGRKYAPNPALAYLFFRFHNKNNTGGGVFLSYYAFNRNTNQLELTEGNSFRQFISLIYDIVIASELAEMRGTSTINMELGEIELIDFQWYNLQNQWKYTRDKKCRIKVKIQTVDNEHRLYFYRTDNLKNYRNENEMFIMPSDIYLTLNQCQIIADAYDQNESFVWKAIDIAINSVK